MIVHYGAKRCLVIALVALGTNVGFNNAARAQPGQADAEAGVQVLTRGPVHEAFAGTVTFNPEPGIIAPKAAPEAIEELPPEQKPEGANIAWIPGYWAWDDERSDFLWVSGIWRALPPARQWVSGYWGKSAKGFQWTSGYWADAKASEVEYLPEPPETVEAGPNIAAPSADHGWIPGSWIWHQHRYAWRPGYWATAQPDWTWVPSYYVWAPRGYVFVDGYWDYSIGRRGVLFAPVYFDSRVYARRDFRYSPMTVINASVFGDHLFVRPRYHHYYFGDYYAADFHTAGYYPSHSIQSRHNHGYDPIYAHRRWEHRKDREWEHRVAAQFQHRRDHEDARPPRTWSAQREHGRNEARSREKGLLVATSFAELAKSSKSGIRFQRMDAVERQNMAQRGQEVRKFREERQRLETRAADATARRPVRDSEPARVRLPRSPIAARAVDQLDMGQAPPKSHVAPQSDPKVEPKPRQVGSKPAVPKREPTVTKREPVAEPPKAQPRPERPKVEPRPERPKAEPRPERPKVEPRPERPKAQPRPERPKAPPRPQVKRNEPKREPPQAQSKERPPRQPKEAPRGESKENPKKSKSKN
jgi:hypothetical protein